VRGPSDFPQYLGTLYLIPVREPSGRDNQPRACGLSLHPPKGSTLNELLVAKPSDRRLQRVKVAFAEQASRHHT
ncbi:MAG: hypothetical protein SGPRY_012328, partial [Prymnesium sp.]